MYTIHEHLDLQISDRERNCLHMLLHMFELSGKEIYLVGGCVRDAMLNKKAKDIDLTTNATPDEMQQICNNFSSGDWNIIETGLKHGTATFYNNLYKIGFEVTTYRADVGYEDHRHPDKVEFSTSLEEDLKRRDLTINSFAYDYNKHEITMLEESYLYDLEYRIIRCVGDPETRFEEDALRMLRAIRFSAQLGFSLDTDTYVAICNKAATIEYVSHERIRDELTKILLSDRPQALELLGMTGLDKYIGLSIITDMMNDPQHNKWHYTDVFHHTVDVIKNVPVDFELRWAAFMHDWGKIKTISFDEEGWEHYYGHPDVSAEMADKFMEEYKFDNASREHIGKLVKYHDVPVGGSTKVSTFKKYVNKIGEDLFDKFLKLTYADRMAHKLLSTDFAIANIDIAKKRFVELKMHPVPMKMKDLAVNGNDLIELGLKGKEIGETLTSLLEYVIENPSFNDKQLLLNKVKLDKFEQQLIADTNIV